jgi:hypothetical protein
MKKILVAIICFFIVAGCSKGKQYTQDLTGSWYVYKVTLNSIQQNNPVADTILNDSITFTSGGLYTKLNIVARPSLADTTVSSTGKWQFQDSYGQLLLTDTSHVQYNFTILNLTGNSVELLSNGFDRYMRKNQ